MKRGISFAVGAYIFWGIHPLYWKLLEKVPAVEIVSHRILWSLLFFTVIISISRGWSELAGKIQKSKNKLLIFIPALLIGSNWGMYIWAINAGYTIETSFGYFICPIFTVFLGVIFLKEKLSRTKWLAVLIAAVGVLIMTFFYGQFPWISLYLAGTWGAYGLLRKKSPLKAAEGLCLETAFLAIPALTYLIYLIMTGSSSFTGSFNESSLLAGTGLISGFPLIIFITGARLIPLSLIGILQYIYPTLIFICGYFIFNEPLDQGKIVGFIFIWTAVIIYSISGSFKRATVNNPA